MRKKKKSERCCRYCQTWFDIPFDKRTYTSGRLLQLRTCPKIKKQVEENNEVCIYFSLAKRFWCMKDICWLEVKSCLSRQNKKTEGCIRCRQGSIIKLIREGMNEKKKGRKRGA